MTLESFLNNKIGFFQYFNTHYEINYNTLFENIPYTDLDFLLNFRYGERYIIKKLTDTNYIVLCEILIKSKNSLWLNEKEQYENLQKINIISPIYEKRTLNKSGEQINTNTQNTTDTTQVYAYDDIDNANNDSKELGNETETKNYETTSDEIEIIEKSGENPYKNVRDYMNIHENNIDYIDKIIKDVADFFTYNIY